MQISTHTWKWLLIGTGLALLAMMIAYPFGYDQMVFMLGGEMTVKHGAIPYRDFLDTKPPVIFFIYGIASTVFGHHEWSIRAFDALFQIAVLFYFFRTLRRLLKNENAALLTVFLYALIYAASGFWMTAQAEGFALLPSIILFDCTERSLQNDAKTLRLGVYAGLASAMLFLLKFTFIVVPFGAVLYLLVQTTLRRRLLWIYILGLATAFTAILGSYALYLAATQTFTRFLESLAWLKGYAAIDPLFSVHTIAERFYISFPVLLVSSLSLSGVVLASFGIIKYFQNHSADGPSGDVTKSTLYLHFFIQFMLGLLAVLYERKFFHYQFTRIYWAFIPFVALGLQSLRVMFKGYVSKWKTMDRGSRILRYSGVAALCCVLLFFSTAVRIFSHPLHWTYLRMTNGDVGADVESKFEQYFYKEEQQLADHLRPLLSPRENIFVWGNSMGIYYFLDKYPTTIVLTSTPLITAWTPQSWKDTTIAQLKSNPPRFFIVEFGDEREYISGTKSDSWQNLQRWDALRSFVESQYGLKETIGHFRIFERRIP